MIGLFMSLSLDPAGRASAGGRRAARTALPSAAAAPPERAELDSPRPVWKADRTVICGDHGASAPARAACRGSDMDSDGRDRMTRTARPPAPDWRAILDRLAAAPFLPRLRRLAHRPRGAGGRSSATAPRRRLPATSRTGISSSSPTASGWPGRARSRAATTISPSARRWSISCFQKGWTHGNFSIVQSVAGACYHMMLSAHLRGFQCIWNAGIGDHAALARDARRCRRSSSCRARSPSAARNPRHRR